jgi:integrase/recombinase XerD
MIRIAIIQDTRREKKDNKYPVKLRVTYNREAKYYPTNIDLTKDEFKNVGDKKTIDALLEVKADINEMGTNANAIIKTLRPFSFAGFEKKFIDNPISKDLLTSLFNNQIKKLNKQGRLGTATCYQTCYNSLMDFDKKLSLEKITGDLLYEYENWMLAKGKSITTVGIYLRSLRAVFNEAIDEGFVPKEFYPFGKKKYQIPTGKNVKKALSLTDIGKFYSFRKKKNDPNYLAYLRAKDFWLFSYFGNGLNVKDIALLKYKNIHGEYIVIERAKTLRTSRSNPQPISIFINEEIKSVIKRWGNADTAPDNFVFPIIDPKTDLVKQRKDIQQFTKVINKWTKKIGEDLGIQAKVTTYTARHSFSTVMKRAGVSVEFISEALGHRDVKTTENYLDSFENEMKKEFSGKLSAFKKNGLRKTA